MFLREKTVEKTFHLLWVDGRDIHYPTDEPNPTWHVESLCPSKPHPKFSNQPNDLAPKLCHMGRHIG